MGPAIYKGEDVTGQQYGLYVVLGCVEKRRYGQHSSRAVWLVKCLVCSEERSSDMQSVMRQRNGCHSCARAAQSGPNSPHWRGGKYVPAYFVATAKTGLHRGNGRVIAWDLGYEYLDGLWEAQEGLCAYTSAPLVFGTSSVEQTASLDRINSELGYVPGNVQFVHKDINIMKGSLSEDRFLGLCQAVTNNAKTC